MMPIPTRAKSFKHEQDIFFKLNQGCDFTILVLTHGDMQKKYHNFSFQNNTVNKLKYLVAYF